MIIGSLYNSSYILYIVPAYVQSPSIKCEVQQTPQQFQQKSLERIEDFIAELKFRHQNSYVKEWTIEQDQKLLQLGKSCQNWKQLSKQFYEKSAKVCHRRYRKLLQKEIKWPRQDEQMIKYLRQVQKKSWVEIQMVLKNKNGCKNLEYKAKKIRERYKNYLQIEVNRQKWTLQQDLRLWNCVDKHGKVWKQISADFPQRSSLQLRNRYYKFLEPSYLKIRQEMNKKFNDH